MKEMRRYFLIEPPDPGLSASLLFLRQSRYRLIEDYWRKIQSAVDPLDNHQVWWRPNESSNSIGNLLMHLAGNVRQWIIAGIGGAEDHRVRDLEFTERELIDKN